MQAYANKSNVRLTGLLFAALFFSCAGSIPYTTSTQKKVIIQGIDIDETLKIGAYELSRDKWGRVLTLWAIRDQHIQPDQAARVADLYEKYIDSLHRQFNIWHLTWAISNMYRNGDSAVRRELKMVYNDAQRRAENLHRVANKHVNGDKVYMGDFHILGRRYKKKHVVTPGNDDYVPSAEDYFGEEAPGNS
jgi:hypothetical protein